LGEKYTENSDLIFWVKGLFALHFIGDIPTTSKKLLQLGEEQTFTFFKSMYPMNIRKEAENLLRVAFKFWKLAKV